MGGSERCGVSEKSWLALEDFVSTLPADEMEAAKVTEAIVGWTRDHDP
jgi:hypothetical protein